MVATTRSRFMTPEMKDPSPNYRYTILFPEGEGYLLVKQLPAGRGATPQLVHSIETGKTCVRKLAKNDNIDRKGFPNEVSIGRSLADSGFVPNILDHRMVHDDQSIIIFEYCDGGDFDNYAKNYVRKEEHMEVLIWHVISRITRIVTYLQTGWVEKDGSELRRGLASDDEPTKRQTTERKAERIVTKEHNKRMRNEEHTESPEANKRMKTDQKQDYNSLIVLQPGWKPIFHGDLHPGNIFLDFARSGTDSLANQPRLPRVLLGDFGYASYDAPDALDLANLLEEMYKLVKYGAVYKCSAQGREALLRALSPYFMDRLVPRVADAFQVLVPVAEEQLGAYNTVDLPRPEYPRRPMLFETPAPMAPEFFLVESLRDQKPWKWVKIAEKDVERGRFGVFEEVSEAEVEKAEATRQFFMCGGRPETLGSDKL